MQRFRYTNRIYLCMILVATVVLLALLILSVLSLCYVIYTHSAMILFPETSPTPLSVERFDEEYGGQRWVAIEGRLATARLRVWPSSGGNDRVNIFVPITPSNWHSDLPVQAVVLVGPVPSDRAAARIAQLKRGQRQRVITGTVVRFDHQRIFPELKFAEPCIIVQEGAAPMERWQAILAVVFFVACLGVASRWLWGAIRGARGFLLGFQDAWERGRWFGEGERELEDYAIRG